MGCCGDGTWWDVDFEGLGRSWARRGGDGQGVVGREGKGKGWDWLEIEGGMIWG